MHKIPVVFADVLCVIDQSDLIVETPEAVAERIRKALPYVSVERIVIAPDCGMKYLPRDVAFGKMQAMVAGAGMCVRSVPASRRRTP